MLDFLLGYLFVGFFSMVIIVSIDAVRSEDRDRIIYEVDLESVCLWVLLYPAMLLSVWRKQ